MISSSSHNGAAGSGKWGELARAGFQSVPDALLVKQRDLGLDAPDMVVFLNLTSYWWFQDRPPFARSNVIAKRMGVSPRTVQRSLKKLVSKGLLRRDEFELEDGTFVPALYLEGLTERLTALAKNDPALASRMHSEASETSEEEDDIPF
jgi:predicted transcriptional regulator